MSEKIDWSEDIYQRVIDAENDDRHPNGIGVVDDVILSDIPVKFTITKESIDKLLSAAKVSDELSTIADTAQWVWPDIISIGSEDEVSESAQKLITAAKKQV